MFTILIAGLCALVVEHRGQPLVVIGSIVDTENCVPFYSIRDTKGRTTIPIDPPHVLGGRGHRYRVEMFQTHATLYVDGQPFIIPRGDGV
jgi:hypothetical protein